MATLSKGCKLINFEPHSSLKLSFTNIWGLCSNFVGICNTICNRKSSWEMTHSQFLHPLFVSGNRSLKLFFTSSFSMLTLVPWLVTRLIHILRVLVNDLFSFLDHLFHPVSHFVYQKKLLKCLMNAPRVLVPSLVIK